MKISGELFTKKINLEDMGLYNKMALAFFFMFIIPLLLTLYLIFLAPPLISDKNMLVTQARIMLIMMTICGLFGYIFIRRVIKKLVAVIKDAEYLSTVNNGERIDVDWNDELK